MPLPTLPPWKLAGLCRAEDPTLWFPQRAEGETNQGIEGKIICARCPVIEPCLRTSIRNHEKQGVWAGAGEPTRRRLGGLARGRGPADEHPDDCTCPFCLAVAEHITALRAAFRDGTVQHGTWEAYLHASCRCGSCQAAYKASGRAPRKAP